MPLALFVISLVFSALISMPEAVEALSRRLTIHFAVLLHVLLAIGVISKTEIGDYSASTSVGVFVILYGICHDPLS